MTATFEMTNLAELQWFGCNTLKVHVVRKIQRHNGEEPCFSTDKRYGCKELCGRRLDCVKLRAEWLRQGAA